MLHRVFLLAARPELDRLLGQREDRTVAVSGLF
jgi:hypothetical protein